MSTPNISYGANMEAVYAAAAQATTNPAQNSATAGSAPLSVPTTPQVYRLVHDSGKEKYVATKLPLSDFSKDGSWSSTEGIIPGYHPSGWYMPTSKPIQEVLMMEQIAQAKAAKTNAVGTNVIALANASAGDLRRKSM